MSVRSPRGVTARGAASAGGGPQEPIAIQINEPGDHSRADHDDKKERSAGQARRRTAACGRDRRQGRRPPDVVFAGHEWNASFD